MGSHSTNKLGLGRPKWFRKTKFSPFSSVFGRKIHQTVVQQLKMLLILYVNIVTRGYFLAVLPTFPGHCKTNPRYISENRAPTCPMGSPFGGQEKIYLPMGGIGWAFATAQAFGLGRAARTYCSIIFGRAWQPIS